MELDEKQMSPTELIDEIERRCFQERGLVILSAGQWQAITEAYHSPMVERIACSALSVHPIREIKTKALSFRTYSQKFQPG